MGAGGAEPGRVAPASSDTIDYGRHLQDCPAQRRVIVILMPFSEASGILLQRHRSRDRSGEPEWTAEMPGQGWHKCREIAGSSLDM